MTASLIVGFDLVGLIAYLCFCFLMDANGALCEFPFFVKIHLTLLVGNEELGTTGEWRKAAKVIFVTGIITNITEASAIEL